VEAPQIPFDEIEDIMVSGSQEKRTEILRLLIEFFLVGGNCSDEQFETCVEFFSHCAEWVDAETRAEFANRLAPEKLAPARIVRALARDPVLEVAAPVLTRSPLLGETDLLACANGKSQDWLLAISRRASLSEVIGDFLVKQGNAEVVRSVAGNAGARFSDAGFGMLVEKCRDDERLAVSVGARQDVPQKFIADLGSRATGEVFKELVRAIAQAREADRKRDYAPVKALYDSIVEAGGEIEPVLYDFARSGAFDQSVVALAVLCKLPVETVGGIVLDRRAGNEPVLALVKRAGLPWPAALEILKVHGGDLAPEQTEAARRYFDKLDARVAQRLVQLHQARYAGNGH
jgi:uncharacterized protein (DUF2336 family)